MKVFRFTRNFHIDLSFKLSSNSLTSFILKAPIENDLKEKIIDKVTEIKLEKEKEFSDLKLEKEIEVSNLKLVKEKEVSDLKLVKEKEFSEIKIEKEILLLKYQQSEKEIKLLKIDRDYLAGKLKARFIIEQFEMVYNIKNQKGRQEAWKQFLENNSHLDFITKMKLCTGKGFQNDKEANIQLSNRIKMLYKNLSQEIHQPSTKTDTGEYLIPIPPEMSAVDKCLLEIMAHNGLEWDKIYFYEIKTNVQE